MSGSDLAIEVRELNKSFPGAFYEKPKQVLFDVSFQVRAGVTTGFIGVNGSGKTTSLKCILGFIRPQKAHLRLFGRDAAETELRRRIGYLPERPYLYEYLTAEEFLKFHWELTGGGEGFPAACRQVLERVNLLSAQQKRIRTFSKGMMQRIGFAQALLRSPDLLILDEPMSGLDPDGRYLMKEIMRAEKGKGKSLFFSTHFLSDVEELCEDLVVIDQGRVLYQGPTMDLIGRQANRKRIVFQSLSSASPQEIVCDQSELAAHLQELQKKSAQILSVSNEYIALEVAFKGLRGQKDSGS